MTSAVVQGDRRSRIGRWLHVPSAVVPAAGLLLQLALLFGGGADVNSGASSMIIPVGVRLIRFFSYFTIQSNILVLVAAILLTVRPARDGTIWRIVRLDSLLAIVITGIVLATILAPLIHPTGAAFVANLLLHYLSPWLFLAVWIVVGPRPRISWTTVGGAFVWPAAWICYTMVHGASSGWYPYPFLDVGQLGYPIAIRNIIVILLSAAVIAILLRFLDRLPTLIR